VLSTILDIVIRSAVVFIVVLGGLRLLGKRHVAQLSIVDLVLILLISNAVQNAMVGPDVSLLGGIVAAVTLLVLSYVFTQLLYRSRRAERFFEGTPTLLIHNGKVIRRHLDQERITEEELERIIREHGIDGVHDVKNAIMEADGAVSVIQKAGSEKHIESFKHTKTKYQQRKI
jgi:uncharacterized membrane protein YcaP (DUF421 family)